MLTDHRPAPSAADSIILFNCLDANHRVSLLSKDTRQQWYGSFSFSVFHLERVSIALKIDGRNGVVCICLHHVRVVQCAFAQLLGYDCKHSLTFPAFTVHTE